MKRLFAIFLCMALVLSVCPQVALATDNPQATEEAEPTAGPELMDETETLDESGPMPGFEPASGAVLLTDTAAPAPSLTTGRLTTTGYHPINIQIENAPGARPQAGLSQADIVYECLMEQKSVTRFQAVFNDRIPSYVGPVRSCRVYFVDIAAEYKGILAFYGGPSSGGACNIYPKISKAIADGNILIAANGLTRQYHPLYWRIKTRRVPHNVYTNLTKTVKLYQKAPVSQSHFLFNANADYSAYETMNTVQVKYTRASTYDTKYVYNASANNYKRYVAGKAFTDANTKKQITVKNIIVQRAATSYFGTKKGHLNIVLIGSGKADIYTKGKHIAATWERPTQADITRYYDESHNEIPIQPGNTWVQVIPSAWTPHFEAKAAFYSSYSASLNVKVGTPAPIAAKPSSYNSIKLTWGKAANATMYEIYRATSSGGAYKLLKTVKTLSYTDKNLRTGTVYYYKVKAYHLVSAVKVKVYGAYSAVASATAFLSIPGSVKASPVSYNSVKITWGAVAGRTKYELYRSTAADGAYTKVTATTARSYVNKNVTTGVKYFYKVRAYRLVGSKKVYSEYSAAASATASLAKPAKAKAARASATSVKVSWRAVAGASKYEVWSAPSAGGTYALVATAGTTSYTHIGLTTGADYYYKVVAFRMVGANKVYGGYSAVVHAKP